MNDQDLFRLLQNGGSVSVPYFNNEAIKIYSEDKLVDGAVEALKNFLGLTNEQRISDGRHLLAYCQMMVDVCGEEILADMGGLEPTVDNIWDYVSITHIFFGKLDPGKYVSKPTMFVQVEGRVGWEPEHGLQMSWADGKKLVKVSEFDGHPTNGHASANPEDEQYVFSCYDPEFRTLPDPT